MPGYVYNASTNTWVPITTGWVYNASTSTWVQIKEGWAYTRVNNVDAWRQIFSSGTFSPLLRLPGGTGALTRRSVGLAIELYRGDTASGSYAYQFQFASGQQTSFTQQSGTNNSGTLTGATTTINYTTDSSDLAALEALSVAGNNTGILDDIDTYRTQEAKNFYMRARVIRSGETQFTQNIIIHKRETINNGSTLTLTRASSGLTYTITGNTATDRQPYVGDTLTWTPNFTNTTTITNDTRPDYYWFSFDSNNGPNYRNSLISDPANPRNPVNARVYTIQSSDVGAPIVCTMRGINTNPNESITNTGTVFRVTRDVSDGTLTAPTNLVLSNSGTSGLRGQWDLSSGGNDNPITYTWYLEREVNNVYTSVFSSTTSGGSFTYSTTTLGNYRFYVTASQLGNPTVTSGFSNVFQIIPPADFTVTVQNVTNTDTYRPSLFSINAPTLSATELNRWIWTWGTSTITGPAYAKSGSFNVVSMNSWTSQLTRPDGTINSFTVSSPTDFWTISNSGNHTETVTARNTRKNYVRVSWTRPPGTSAVSYSVYVSGYFPGAATTPDWNLTINVGDINFVDIEQDYFANGTNYGNSSVIRVNSVRAFSGENQTGTEKFGNLPSFNFNGADGTTDWSNCNVVGTRQASRTDNLSLEVPTVGTIITTGTFEPSQTLSLTGGTGWSPAYSNWSFTYNWRRSIAGASPTSAGTASTVTTASTSAGDEYFCIVTPSYKGTTYSTITSTGASIVPGPPVFPNALVDNFNGTFSISGSFISALDGQQYYGTYSGSSSGTVTATNIGTTFTSPSVTPGNISVTLNSRKNVFNQSFGETIEVNSTRSSTNSITIQTPPQSTSSRRYLTGIFNIGPGSTVYVSTNGYLGTSPMAGTDRVTPPSSGNFLNIAAQDLDLNVGTGGYFYTRTDANGFWIRYRGQRYTQPTRYLEYQAYFPYNGTDVYVLFIENSLIDFNGNNAYYQNGVVTRTWSQSSSDSTGFTINQGTSGWTQRTSVDNGSLDDGYFLITIIAPAIPMNPNPTVTRTAGGFTFNVTNQSSGVFESAASYSVTTISGTATPSINSVTGLVTVTGMTANSFATIRVTKTRTGYQSTTIDVAGQALQGSPPSQITAPSISVSGGSVDGSGTVRRAERPTVLTRVAGTYNNQQSIQTAFLTLLSNVYTGANSDWTNLTDFGSTTTISNTAASSSANMYRVRDRVVGTDGSTVDFYSPVIYRAVYQPPTSVFLSSRTQNTITLGYTGSGSQRIYAYKDGAQDTIVTSPAGEGISSTFTYTGLLSGTSYSLLLYGGNNEGYLSINASGSTYETLGSNLITPTILSASQSTAGGALTVTVSGGGPAYQIWWQSTADTPTVSGFDASSTTTTIVDSTGPGSAGTWYVSARSVSNVSNTGVGPSATISAWSPTRSFTVGGGGGGTPPSTPTITGNNSLALGGTFSWTFTGGTAPFTYSVFCSGPSGTVYTTSNQYTWGTASFRPAYDGTGGTNGTGWQGSGTYSIAVSVRDSAGLTSSAGSGSTFMS